MITGLEVAGVVAAIVSALNSAATLYQDWRNARRERKDRKENEDLNQLVKYSGLQVQQEYDQDFRRLGQGFARGDGTPDAVHIVRWQLTEPKSRDRS